MYSLFEIHLTMDLNTQIAIARASVLIEKLNENNVDSCSREIQMLLQNSPLAIPYVISIVCSKAFDEPEFCRACAELCHDMQMMPYSDPNAPERVLNFRIILINKCQQLFEKNEFDELKADEKEQEIKSCTDPEKKKELQLRFEDEERRIRHTSVGNCRFIGELFKLGMLTSSIMTRCIHQLLQRTDEISLECLCQLLITIGKMLGEKMNSSTELDVYFKSMKELSEKNNSKISSRIRFMLLDVIDLRNKWAKTIDQIDQEFEQTQYNERMKTGGSRSIKTVFRKYNYPKSTGSNKFRVQPVNDVLGSASAFKNWGTGASGSKSRDTSRNFGSSSMYGMSSLSANNPTNDLNRPAQPSHSMERNLYNTSREGNEPERYVRSSDSINAVQNVQPSWRESSKIRPVYSTSQPIIIVDPNLKEDEIARKSESILDEYCLHHNIEETVSFVQQWLHSSYKEKVVRYLFEYVMEKDKKYREELGVLLSELISKNIFDSSHVVQILTEFVDLWADLIIDYPYYWTYLAEIIVPILSSDGITFEDIRRASEHIYQGHQGGNYISNVLNKARRSMGTQLVCQKWIRSDVKLTHFIKPDDLDEFVQTHSLQYLLHDNNNNNDCHNDNNRETKYRELIKKYIDTDKTQDILNYVKSASNNESRQILIRALSVILEEDYNNNGSVGVLFPIYKTNIQYLIDNHEESLEVQCLTSINDMMARLEYPKGLLLAVFEKLLDSHIISTDGFQKWKDSPCDSKGVALKQLISFFEYIRENPK